MPNTFRLLAAIRTLKAVQADHRPFNLCAWTAPLSENDLLEGWEKIIPAEGNPDHPCGTIACAAGWCAQDPWHIAEGFYLSHETNGQPHYLASSGWPAVTHYFDINLQEARHIFDAPSYTSGDKTTIDQVIARIQQLLRTSTSKGTRN